MRGAGFLAIWSDVESKDLTDYRHWLTREHTTERVTTKGFLASRVFRLMHSDLNRFFILYELESPEVLDGPAYLARLNAPTPWSQRIMPLLGNFIRGGGVMAARAGRGEGSIVVALRLENLPKDAGATGRRDRRARRHRRGADRRHRPCPDLGADDRKGHAQERRDFRRPPDHRGAGRRHRSAPRCVGWPKWRANWSANIGDAEVYQGMFALDARIADVG